MGRTRSEHTKSTSSRSTTSEALWRPAQPQHENTTRSRVEGHNGAMRWAIFVDAPAGHGSSKLKIVKGIELRDDDTDNGQDVKRNHSRRRREASIDKEISEKLPSRSKDRSLERHERRDKRHASNDNAISDSNNIDALVPEVAKGSRPKSVYKGSKRKHKRKDSERVEKKRTNSCSPTKQEEPNRRKPGAALLEDDHSLDCADSLSHNKKRLTTTTDTIAVTSNRNEGALSLYNGDTSKVDIEMEMEEEADPEASFSAEYLLGLSQPLDNTPGYDQRMLGPHSESESSSNDPLAFGDKESESVNSFGRGNGNHQTGNDLNQGLVNSFTSTSKSSASSWVPEDPYQMPERIKSMSKNFMQLDFLNGSHVQEVDNDDVESAQTSEDPGSSKGDERPKIPQRSRSRDRGHPDVPESPSKRLGFGNLLRHRRQEPDTQAPSLTAQEKARKQVLKRSKSLDRSTRRLKQLFSFSSSSFGLEDSELLADDGEDDSNY